MKFSVNPQLFRTALARAGGHIKPKNTIPVLEHLFIETAGERRIRITGNDLDVLIRAEMDADVEQAGSGCIHGRMLGEAVRTLSDTIHISLDGWANIKSGKTKFRLPALDATQYPLSPDPVALPVKVPAKILKDFLRLTGFAMTTEPSRFTLGGAKLEAAPNLLRVVTTDGSRLALASKNLETGGEVDCLIPKLAVDRLVRVLAEGDILIGEDQNHIFFEQGDLWMAARKLSGNFPNYEMILPKDAPFVCEIDAARLKDALLRTIPLSDQGVYLSLEKDSVTVTAKNRDGEASDQFDIDHKGENIKLKFQGSFLRQLLDVAAGVDIEEDAVSRSVRIHFSDPNNAVDFGVAQELGYEYRYIVMPLREVANQ